MSEQPFVSVRKHIKWGEDPAGENTDTLVLTSAAKSFVDVRVYLPDVQSFPASDGHRLPIERLEWGFAGTAQSTPAILESDGKVKIPAHTVWMHWIDSKTQDEVQDEGDMYPQPNGEVLEYGAMLNPNKNAMEKYEECWVDLDPKKVGNDVVFKSWVLRYEKGELGVKGMFVRIGEHVQGILLRFGQVSVVRYKWTDGKGWETVLQINELQLPPKLVEDEMVMVKGDMFNGHGIVWECVEAYEWN